MTLNATLKSEVYRRRATFLARTVFIPPVVENGHLRRAGTRCSRRAAEVARAMQAGLALKCRSRYKVQALQHLQREGIDALERRQSEAYLSLHRQ